MSEEEIRRILEQYAERYPPLVSAPQAAEIADVPLPTVYQWSSQGEFDDCKSRRGKRLRISRDCLVLFLIRSKRDN